MSEAAGPILVTFLHVSAAFLFLQGICCFAALVKGWLVLRRHRRAELRDDTSVLLKSPLVPPVSVIAVAGDASTAARESVRRLLGLHFGQLEVILVLNGLPEADLAAWEAEFRLEPCVRPPATAAPEAKGGVVRSVYESRDPLRLIVIDLASDSLAGALNAGLAHASAPIVALIDPECEFQPGLLLRLVRPMLEEPETTSAVCALSPAPPLGGLAGCFGALESLRLWLVRGAAFSGWNRLAPVRGSAVAVRRVDALLAGGFRGSVLELVLDVHRALGRKRKPYRVAWLPEPVCHGRQAGSFSDLRRAARRDQQDVARMFGNASSRWALGWAVPGLFLVRHIRPLVECAAYAAAAAGFAVGLVDAPLVAVVLLSTAGMGIVVSMAAVVLRELAETTGSDPGRLTALFFAAIPENLGYRQIRNLWLISGPWFGNVSKSKNRGPGLLGA